MPRMSTCSVCSKPVYLSRSSRPEITCHECRRKEPRKYKPRPRKYLPTPCTECGSIFQPSRQGRKYCSRACAQKSVGWTSQTAPHGSRWTSETAPRKSKTGNGSSRRTAAKVATRRRRLLVAATWDGVTDEQILERDQWMCWICQQGIGKTLKWPDPQSASIDHLIPLSRGGDDTAGNKHSAHLGCNMSRQTGRLGEQFPPGFNPVPLAGTVPKIRKPVALKPETRRQPGKLPDPLWWTTVRPLIRQREA